MSEILSREQTERQAGETRVRRLAYSDLPNVISIERRSFPTPWSLAMFVLELSKPSGICLAATRGDELAGYVVCLTERRRTRLMRAVMEIAAELRQQSPVPLDAPKPRETRSVVSRVLA